MRKKLILAIFFTAVTLIGLISFICKTRGVNAGAFILPGIIAIFLFAYYIRATKP